MIADGIAACVHQQALGFSTMGHSYRADIHRRHDGQFVLSSQVKIGARHGVSQRTVSDIALGYTWSGRRVADGRVPVESAVQCAVCGRTIRPRTNGHPRRHIPRGGLLLGPPAGVCAGTFLPAAQKATADGR